MVSPRQKESIVRSNAIADFELHSLGWKSFQDLCATILRQVLGQTIQQFFDSNDGGRDGAFRGVWQRQDKERFRGNFTIQCKFTAKRDKQLGVGDLRDELKKAERLGTNGLANTYILMTNAKLTGTTDEKLRQKFCSLHGIEYFDVFGHEWISSAIRESSRLRMLVPRIYGLGDLSQILDERAYGQATEILSSLGSDLEKFVITDAHRKSVKALVEHGFVLLLGEPASGKSTIAAALAVAAIDEWRCSTLKIRSADEFARHWNPHEPKQLFWIDDAFGATQLDRTTATEWNHVFPHMRAALRKGARVIFTSRDYIFRSAQLFLKESAFPLLTKSQVIIQVEQLTKPEREQILYNHIKLGRQTAKYRSKIKQLLPMVAAHSNFKPEIARRLSDPLFTKNLFITEQGISKFVAHPLEHLGAHFLVGGGEHIREE
uniref:Restriction endonuclease n=1 Tax=Candidatus Kentrum sp. DK TaxID=2126562 RepID=A0A450TGB6_9GAMM|nr:MAG: Restriction endonuclease [Candidatus Kentron sp. DK]